MVDASICQGMELGPPQVSLAALNELRAVLRMDATSPNQTPTSVSSLDKEGGSGETAAKNIQPAADAVTGVPNDDKSTRRKGTEEAIRALADLLLEALGEVSRESMEGPNESED
jgi:hypothetical protein